MKRFVKMLMILTAWLMLISPGQDAQADSIVLPDPMEMGYKMIFAKNADAETFYQREYLMYDRDDVDNFVAAYMDQMLLIEELKYVSCTEDPKGWKYHLFAPAQGETYRTLYSHQDKWETVDYCVAILYHPKSDYVKIIASKDISLWSEQAKATKTPSVAKESKKNTSGNKTVATNDGLTVLSPEQYLGIEPCDKIYREDNHYTYAYTDRGYKYHGSGTSNPVDWYKMEEYVNALVDSGYYEILEHSDDTDDAYWTLRYIGPAKVNNTFDLYYGMSDQAAITLRNFIGNIKIRYSIDILTADIDETQQRLGETVVGTQQSTSAGSSIFGKRCSTCGGDGRCNSCGGSGQVWKWAGDMYAYVRCTAFGCSGGSCSNCGGDGID